MTKQADSLRIPLPRGWPSRVKSAMLHVISLAQFALAYTRGWAVNSQVARVRLKANNERLRQQIALLTEEIRIKDARMKRIAPPSRPHYTPTERMAILELRAARAWSTQQAADVFLVTAATIASWMKRLDEEGPNALIQIREPVNKFPDFGVQGEAVSEMREGLSWPGDRTRPQTSPNCGGQESSWEASGAKGAA
jgi:hypothetical protein